MTNKTLTCMTLILLIILGICKCDNERYSKSTSCFGNLSELDTDQTHCPLENLCISIIYLNSTKLNFILELNLSLGWAGIQLATNNNSINNGNILTTGWATSDSSLIITDRILTQNALLIPLKNQLSFFTPSSVVSPNCTRIILDRDLGNWAKDYSLQNSTQLRWKWIYSSKFPTNYEYDHDLVGFEWEKSGEFYLNTSKSFLSYSEFDYGEVDYELRPILLGNGKGPEPSSLLSLFLMILSTNVIPFLGLIMTGSLKSIFKKRWLIYHIIILALLTPASLIAFLVQISLNSTKSPIYSKQKWGGIIGLFLYLTELILGLITRFKNSKTHSNNIIIKIHSYLAYILFMIGPICTYLILIEFNNELVSSQLVCVLFSILLTAEVIALVLPKFFSSFNGENGKIENLNYKDLNLVD